MTQTLSNAYFYTLLRMNIGRIIMITLRKASDRGPTNLGWLDSKHTFSFGSYYDEKHMGFQSLRVINDDRVIEGAGFGTHPHKNMEIVSYVLDGALEHQDSMGNGSVINKGDVQLLSAGTGITHSEYNHSKKEEVHFLQIWIMPKEQDRNPSYSQKYFNTEEKRGKLRLVVSHDGREDSLSINQNVNMLVGLLDGDETITYALANKAWVHIARGEVNMCGHTLKAGDGASIDEETELYFKNGKDAEFIIFDMAS